MEILQFYSKLHPISLNVQYSIILNSQPFLISLHRASRFSGHNLSPSSIPDAHELQYSIAQQFLHCSAVNAPTFNKLLIFSISNGHADEKLDCVMLDML